MNPGANNRNILTSINSSTLKLISVQNLRQIDMKQTSIPSGTCEDDPAYCCSPHTSVEGIVHSRLLNTKEMLPSEGTRQTVQYCTGTGSSKGPTQQIHILEKNPIDCSNLNFLSSNWKTKQSDVLKIFKEEKNEFQDYILMIHSVEQSLITTSCETLRLQ